MPTTCLDASTLITFVSLAGFIGLVVGCAIGIVVAGMMDKSSRDSNYMEGWEDRAREEWRHDQQLLAQIKRMQDFLCGRGLYQEYLEGCEDRAREEYEDA